MAATATAKQTVAKAPETPEPEAAPKAATRTVRPLSPTMLQQQSVGFVYREMILRLPADVILQDLQDNPGLWRAIQGAADKALRVLDRVTVIAFDQSWIVKDALVIEADTQTVKLAIRPGDVIRLTPQAGTWRDDRHEIKFAGSGYGAYRLSDGVEVLAAQYATVEACKAALFAQHYTVTRVN